MQEARLDKVGADGKTLRQTLNTVARMKGYIPKEGINPVEFPEVLSDLWDWSKALGRSRGEGVNGELPVSHTEMHSFFALRGISPSTWQLDVLQTLDLIALGRLSFEPEKDTTK